MSSATADRDRTAPRALPVIGKLESPVTTYYLILGTMTTLVVFGLVMVFSASSVTSLLGGDPSYSVFLRQLLFAVVGAVVARFAARLTIRWWKRLAVPLLGGSVLLQLLVFTPLGYEVGGNRNWLDVGPISVQPAELAKVALVLVGAVIFANKGRLVSRLGHAVVPYLLPIASTVVVLVLLGKDLGTAMVMLLIVAAVLAVAGVPGRFFAGAGLFGAAVVALLVVQSSNRMARITNFLSVECRSDPNGECGQSVHGLYALADGGWWGVGLGASKEKWAWLAEAHNDFIFAVIGEELGLPGTMVILFLFALLAWACYRLVVRTQDRFVRIATAGILAWLLGQAIINIGAVIGLFPVVGVPLPLVSAGGSSLVTTMLALGMLLSFARNEPGCRQLLDARPSRIRASLAILPSRSLLRRGR
ncbi:MAG TPA: putative lipid II flippase FtsW [Intrasporangium sp.]|uniref:putative lipid II flippase FtsW n=1 Tax=Intrasporangium sp. TaxID=1925024 RepID=UPI002D79C0D2|nr:putative lipid II flippase FtsW [Intrasporangium sp.]HET7398527.1 putative lipid II flippase FtsW [Intrasporangium sp.]